MVTRSEPELQGDVTIDGGRYRLVRDPRNPEQLAWGHPDSAEVQEGRGLQPVSAVWQQGFPEGMGHTRMAGPDDMLSYAYGVGLDASVYPYVQMVGRRISVAPSVAPLDKPTFFFEDLSATGTPTPITQIPLTTGSGAGDTFIGPSDEPAAAVSDPNISQDRIKRDLRTQLLISMDSTPPADAQGFP